jgi:IQ calmodulin-binding motif
VKTGVSRPTSAVRSTAKSSPKSSPKALTYDEVLGKLTSKEEEEKKLPLMRYRDYQRIQADLEHRVAAVAEEAVVQKEDTRRAEAELRYDSAVKIQSLARGRQARKQYARMESERELQLKSAHASTKIQAAYRGKRGREKASGLRAQKDRKLVEDNSIVNIQRMVRGHQSRGGVRKIKQEKSAVTIQKVVRGRQARVSFAEKRAEAQTKMRQYRAATKIQAAYRMHVTFRTYKELQILAVCLTRLCVLCCALSHSRSLCRWRQWRFNVCGVGTLGANDSNGRKPGKPRLRALIG